MNLGSDFSGDQAKNYAMFRRGYPPSVVCNLAEAFALGPQSLVLDLGCGTGQLTLPLASVSGRVIGADPQADMLRLARVAGIEQSVSTVTWVLAADSDVPALGRMLGDGSINLVTVGNAIHWMRSERLFTDLVRLIPAGGGIAILTNGSPLWLQDTDWARALRAYNETWFGPVTSTCGTSEPERQSYRGALAGAGFTDLAHTVISYDDDLTLDYVIGHLASAISDCQLSTTQRADYACGLRDALLDAVPAGVFDEHVDVDILLARH